MAVIASNNRIGEGWYELTLTGVPQGGPGQFLMLRPEGEALDPFLPRPISLFDATPEEARLVYQCVGRGTRALATLAPGDALAVTGPLGTGFPVPDADLAVIGGGVGIAPLYYLVKRHRERYPNRSRRVYLGFREEPLLVPAYQAIADDVQIDVGGYITDKVTFDPNTVCCACGPDGMLRAAATLARSAGAALYVSLEAYMACGVGACLGCTVPTRSGNRRVCKEGPVFDAREVYHD